MKIKSIFENNKKIPVIYTCDGENINPPLEFLEIPLNSKSLVLLIDDPDAPSGDWVHWIVWNIDSKINQIKQDSFPKLAVQGLNDFNKNEYGGPCPPSGVHRYFFKLYALDTKLNLGKTSKKQDVLNAMKNHVIDRAELVGLYGRG
jgi:Raf kinase inhibitor-like YbhB/YbcL family protein